MNKIILLILVISANTVFSQNNCANEVSTNPDDPYNSNLPITQESYPNVDLRFINNFDWADNGNIDLHNMSTVYQYPMTQLQYPFAGPHYDYIVDGEDMSPENGWELMMFNIGQYANGDDNPTIGMQDIPYIVLYNRFTGILRVFAAYGSGLLETGLSFEGVTVRLVFDDLNEVNGNFRLRNGNDVPLNQNTETILTQSIAFHPNHSSRWFSCDFQLAYDPCVCYYPSKIKVEFEFLQSMSMSLYGRSITVTDDIANGNDLLINNYLTNYSFPNGTSTSSSSDVIVMYKVMDDFVNDYIERLEKYKDDLQQINEHNKEVERNLVVVKIFKAVILGGTGAVIDNFIGTNDFNDFVTYGYDLFHKNNSTQKEIDQIKEKITSEAKAALGKGVNTLIQKNFEKLATPEKPKTPTASFSEITMQGYINEETLISGPTIYTPGTYGSEGTGSPIISDALEYPIYNNPVGTFALLYSPTLKAYKEIRRNSHTGEEIQYETTIIQYQLSSDIHFALNNHNIKSYEIKVGISADVGFGASDDTTDFNIYTNPIFCNNLNSDLIPMDKFYPIHVNDGIGIKDSTWPAAYTQTTLPNWNYHQENFNVNSDYFPIDAIKPVVFSFATTKMAEVSYQYSIGHFPQFYSFSSPEYYLKILIDVEFYDLDENGKHITNTLMFTYDIDDIEWVNSPLDVDPAISTVNYSEFEENLILNTTDFDGSPINGCKLVGNHYTCHGWDDVLINGDLTTSNGYTVDIIGGNEVTAVPESSVSPEIVLDIGTLLDYSDPMPRADEVFVRDYCKNQLGGNFPGYSANIPTKNSTFGAIENNEPYNENDQEALNFVLYPVPTNNNLYLKLSKKQEELKITIFDVSGRVIDCKYNTEDNRLISINTAHLSNGTYYVQFNGANGGAKKMFIINH